MPICRVKYPPDGPDRHDFEQDCSALSGEELSTLAALRDFWRDPTVSADDALPPSSLFGHFLVGDEWTTIGASWIWRSSDRFNWPFSTMWRYARHLGQPVDPLAVSLWTWGPGPGDRTVEITRIPKTTRRGDVAVVETALQRRFRGHLPGYFKHKAWTGIAYP